jgi:multidrug efflux pump
MISIVVAGLSSYLGRSEDPAFTFRTKIVQAAWPGATLDDTLTQVTERLERKLRETVGGAARDTAPGLAAGATK